MSPLGGQRRKGVPQLLHISRAHNRYPRSYLAVSLQLYLIFFINLWQWKPSPDMHSFPQTMQQHAALSPLAKWETPVSDKKVSVTKNVHFPIRAERRTREVRRWEHPKMCPSDCVFAHLHPHSTWPSYQNIGTSLNAMQKMLTKDFRVFLQGMQI